MSAPRYGERVMEDDEKDVDVGRGDDDLEEDPDEEIEEDPVEEEFEEDPDEEEFEEEEEVEGEEDGDAEEVEEGANDGERDEVEEGGGDEEGGAEEVREVVVDEETEHVEQEEEEVEEIEDEDVSEEEVGGDEELQAEDEEEVEEDELDALEEDEDVSEEEVGGDEELQGEDEEEAEEDAREDVGSDEELHGEDEEEVEDVDESEEDEDVKEDEEFELDVDEDLQCEEKEEQDEEEAVHNEEDGANEEAVEHDKPLTPPISSEKDTTGLRHISLLGKNHDSAPTAHVLLTESQIGYKTESGGLGDKIKDTENSKPPFFAEAEALKNENVNCPSRGVKEMKSDYAERETSQDINKKDAEVINFSALHSESIGFEATKPLSTNPPIFVEAGATQNEKVDRASEGEGLKKMESDCEEKERNQHVNKKDAEDFVDVFARSSESKRTEIAKPLSPVDTKMVTCENNELVYIHEGGVEDMDLDSEENFAHGSDIDGTVVDSIQQNTAPNSHHEMSFKTVADALSSRTVVAESLKSSSSPGTDTILNNELKLDGGGRYMNLNPKDCTMPEPSSTVATSIKQRRSSPCTQLMDRNKRPAVICDYYAKGWCIKGNSCRFLHVKENTDNINKQQGKDLASANGQNQVGEGIGDGTKNTFPEQHAESHIRQLNNNLGHSSLDSRFLHSLRPEFGCGSVASSSAFASRLRPVTESIDYRRSQQLYNDPLQSIANRYIKQHLHPSSAMDMYTSRYISPVNGSSNPIISLNSNPFDVPKSLGSRAQLDPLNSHGLTLKAEMYKWEPSKPFRPSYYFSIPSLTSPGSMYDPLRDSIEQTSLGIGSLKAELIHYPSHQQYPEAASAGNHFEIDGYNGTMLDRNGHSRVTGLPVALEEAAESSVADQGNLRSAPEGDKGSGTSRGKDLSETNKTKAGSAAKKRKTVDEKIHSSGVDVEDEQRESKTFRQFRVALIDFIKELLKPAWREGNLSKDAHNLIVKKAAEKVLSSLHSHLVPSSPELVQQYLSASQPKITKLVEAYVQKHSKA